MNKPSKCIIDNWSLEHAGLLLDGSTDLKKLDDNVFLRNLGGLSNYINAILLYEQPQFVINGFESHWKRFKWFGKNTKAFFKGVKEDISIDWNSKASYSDHGIKNYLLTSKYFGADLLVSPERAEEIEYAKIPVLDSTFFNALQRIDKGIREEVSGSSFKNVKVGVKRNFLFPTLTQYTLSQATDSTDLFTVIMQLKSDGKIKRVTEELEEIASTTKGAGKLEAAIDSHIKVAFGKANSSTSPHSISVSAFGLSFSKSLDLSFFNRKDSIVFLKHLISCRAEAFKLKKDVKRVFRRDLIL